MAEFLFPSSFQCDCKHELHFSEGSVREMKKISARKKDIQAGDSAKNEHFVIFSYGKATHILCPTRGKCKIEK